MNEFFFRVASLAFETSVLAELEKSGSRQIGEVVSEYPSESADRRLTAAGFKTQPVVCFRNQQQLEQPEQVVQEETVQLLPVTKEAAAGGQRTERWTVFSPRSEAEER